MDQRYRKTFDQITLPEDKAQAMGRRLAARCSDATTKQEVIPMKQSKPFRRPAVILVAAVLACALSATAFAYGDKIVENVYTFMTGGTVVSGVTADGENYIDGTSEPEETADPIETRDGRTYLTIDGQNKDITDQFTYETPYIYKTTGSDGLEHAFLIGGNPDAVGWAEFIVDKDGTPTAGSASFGTSEGSEDAPWMFEGMRQLDLPWANQ